MFEEIRIILPTVITYHQAWVHRAEEWPTMAVVEAAINKCHTKAIISNTISKVNMEHHTDKTLPIGVPQPNHAEDQWVCRSIISSSTHSLRQT